MSNEDSDSNSDDKENSLPFESHEDEQGDEELAEFAGTPPNSYNFMHPPIICAKTPKGSVVYNPFIHEYMHRSMQMTFSPNVFRSSTPTKESVGFSPVSKAELFPEDINENPIYQYHLEAHNNIKFDIQDNLHQFFSSQVVVPSPAIGIPIPRNAVTVTPKTRRQDVEDELTDQNSFGGESKWDVGTQTGISIPKHCDDLWKYLPSEFFNHDEVDRKPSAGNPVSANSSGVENMSTGFLPNLSGSGRSLSRRKLFGDYEPLEVIKEKSDCDMASLGVPNYVWASGSPIFDNEKLSSASRDFTIPKPEIDEFGQPVSPPLNLSRSRGDGSNEEGSFRERCSFEYQSGEIRVGTDFDISPVKRNPRIELSLSDFEDNGSLDDDSAPAPLSICVEPIATTSICSIAAVITTDTGYSTCIATDMSVDNC